MSCDTYNSELLLLYFHPLIVILILYLFALTLNWVRRQPLAYNRIHSVTRGGGVSHSVTDLILM